MVGISACLNARVGKECISLRVQDDELVSAASRDEGPQILEKWAMKKYQKKSKKKSI